MCWKTLEVERSAPILRIRLNRPKCHNALDTHALTELHDLFMSLERDFETRVVILSGNGPSFCAGADLRDPPGWKRISSKSDASERERRWIAQLGLRTVRAICDAELVTIARLHGHVIGGGVLLAAACDFRIAASDTLFHVPEVDLGIPLSWGGAPLLIHELGAARARQMILMCDPIEAECAERWGLVHHTVPIGSLDAVVEDWAQRLAAKAEAAVHMTKTQLRSYALRARLGDVTECDGDLLRQGARSAMAARFLDGE